MRYRDRDGLKEETLVWPASVLDVLRSFSARWARIYGWEEEDMTLWLLSGQRPRFAPLKVKIRYKNGSPLAVTLIAHPWLSAKTVQNNYLKLQRQLFGKDNYRLASRSLDVLRFVEGRTREEGKRPSFRKLLEEWNRERPEERFADLRNFARVYKDTLDRVAHHPFSLPPPKPLSLAAKRKRARRVAEAEGIIERFTAALKATEDSSPIERGDEGKS